MIFIDVPGPLQASLSEQLMWQGKHGGDMFVMHEHINFFAKRSLNRLVRACGLVPVFEFRARHTAQSIIAVFENSEMAQRLLLLKEQRRLLYEAKVARAVALDASEWTWRASDAAALRVIKTTTDAINHLGTRLTGTLVRTAASRTTKPGLSRHWTAHHCGDSCDEKSLFKLTKSQHVPKQFTR